MNSRRPPLKTCGVSFIKLAEKIHNFAQNFNGPFGFFTTKFVRFSSIAYPLFLILKFQLFILFLFFDFWILALESLFEMIYPSSGHVFDKLDQFVGFVEILPGKFDEAVNRFPSILCQVPVIYSVWVRVFSLLDFFLSESRYEPIVRSKNIEEDYIMLSKYKNDPRFHHIEKDYLSNNWGSGNMANNPIFPGDSKVKKWEAKSEAKPCQEFQKTTQSELENGPHACPEDKNVTEWGSENETNTFQESPRSKEERKVAKWRPRNEYDTRQETLDTKKDNVSRKRVSESRPNTHQESKNNAEEDSKITNWESRKKQATCQESPGVEKDRVASVSFRRSYKDALAKGTEGKGEKGGGGKGERRRKKKR